MPTGAGMAAETGEESPRTGSDGPSPRANFSSASRFPLIQRAPPAELFPTMVPPLCHPFRIIHALRLTGGRTLPKNSRLHDVLARKAGYTRECANLRTFGGINSKKIPSPAKRPPPPASGRGCRSKPGWRRAPRHGRSRPPQATVPPPDDADLVARATRGSRAAADFRRAATIPKAGSRQRLPLPEPPPAPPLQRLTQTQRDQPPARHEPAAPADWHTPPTARPDAAHSNEPSPQSLPPLTSNHPLDPEASRGGQPRGSQEGRPRARKPPPVDCPPGAVATPARLSSSATHSFVGW